MIGIRLWREGSKGGGRAAAERLGSEIGIEDRGSLPGNRHPERQRRNVGRPIKRKALLWAG